MIGTNHLGVNLTFARFVFVTLREDDDAAGARLRAAGAALARGFFNEFDSPNGHEGGPHETVQFLAAPAARGSEGIAAARYAVHICSKYRPRLQEADAELRRRLGSVVAIEALEGATRVPQYTSAALYAHAFKRASGRTTGRTARNVIIVPIRKTADWWALHPLERHTFFYPHTDGRTGTRAEGHATAAEEGISTIYRRLYYHPDGHSQEAAYDFITYFECPDEQLETFDRIRQRLRDEKLNPEWRYVIEGPEWRGHRVLRW